MTSGQIGQVLTDTIRIDRNGGWHYQGSPIGRKELVCLFASVLKREADGSYWLETPVERGRIEVEDVPFLAVEMCWKDCDCGDGTPRQCLSFRTNLDEIVTANADHPIRVHLCPVTREPRPYITIRPGLEAKISDLPSGAKYAQVVRPRPVLSRRGVFSPSVCK